jgi:hypothetical protein
VSSDNGPNGANQPTARHSGNFANTASGHAKGRHCLSAGSCHPCLDAAMARADLLIDSVRAGAEDNQELFQRTLEALISGGRSKEPLIGTGSTSLDASPLRRFQRMQGEAV